MMDIVERLNNVGVIELLHADGHNESMMVTVSLAIAEIETLRAEKARFRDAVTDMPAYVDIARLRHHLCICDRTVDAWLKEGLLPPPRVIKGKRLWKWAEVERRLDGGASTVPSSPDEQADRIRNATKAALQGG